LERPEANEVSADESLRWEQEWIRATGHLQQWAQLGDVAAHLARPDLVLSGAALAGDTRHLELLCDQYGTDSHPALPIRGLLYRLQILLHHQAQLVLHLADPPDPVVLDPAGAPVPAPILLQRITIKQNATLDRAIDIALQVT
jgi:hypothetical protein